MNYYSVLIVDDDRREVLDLAAQEFPPGGAIRLRTAQSKAAALKLLQSEFFHLALVDPRLDKNDRKFEGFVVLAKLKEMRPSCERIILTNLGRREAEAAEPIAAQLHPIDGFAQGILNKTDMVNSFRRVIEQKAGPWINAPLMTEGAAAVGEKLLALFAQRRRKTKSAITEAEIDFLVSRVFGQGELWGLRHDDLGIGRVQLELIARQGFSPAAVVKAQCFSRKDVPGVLCVIKFAAREYVAQELARYSRYVRYRLAVHHRVELLGWAFGDNLGALCYHFAGVTSLSDLFLKQDAGFFRALHEMFSQQSWYRDVCAVRLAEHFHSKYETDGQKVKELIKAFTNDLEKQFHGSRHGDQVLLCGVTLPLPLDVLDKAVFARQSPGCVVHGDLHSDNVIVGDRHRPMLIDYYYVDEGPRAMDFASLEANVRMLATLRPGGDGNHGPDPRPDEEVIPELLQLRQADEAVWQSVWEAGPVAPDTSAAVNWVTASTYIGNLARMNFTREPPLTEEEYAATCLLWVMRLFKVDDIPQRTRVRLLAWASVLLQVLKGK